MKTAVLLAAFLLLSSVLVTANPAAPSPTVVSYSKYAMVPGGSAYDIGSSDYDLVTVVEDFPAGMRIGMGPHGGFLMVTVISGAMTLNEGGEDRVIRAGESWKEKPGKLDSLVNAGPGPARIVVSALLPKGAEITTTELE